MPGVYDGQHSRRKFFEFDQVFPPTTSQIQVFEEAKPLATSTLDGTLTLTLKDVRKLIVSFSYDFFF